jgi:hypothetical protein
MLTWLSIMDNCYGIKLTLHYGSAAERSYYGVPVGTVAGRARWGLGPLASKCYLVSSLTWSLIFNVTNQSIT